MSIPRLRKDKFSKLWSFLHEMKFRDLSKNPINAIILMGNGKKSRMRLHKRKRHINEEKKSKVIRGKKSRVTRKVKGEGDSHDKASNKRKRYEAEKAQVLKAYKNEPSKLKKSTFSCEICARGLSTKSNLQRHYSLKHSKEENF